MITLKKEDINKVNTKTWVRINEDSRKELYKKQFIDTYGGEFVYNGRSFVWKEGPSYNHITDRYIIEKPDKTVDKKVRETQVGFFPAQHWVESIVKKYVYDANINAEWNFILDSSECVQFGCYEVGAFYKEHRDMDHKIYGNRKLSVSIQLTDGDRYDGGDFLLKNFWGGELEMAPGLRKKGSIIVFPSILLHQVTKVRAGTRHSLVQWYSGPDFV